MAEGDGSAFGFPVERVAWLRSGARGKRNDGDAYYKQSGNLEIAHLQSPSKRSSAGGARRGS